MLQHIKNRVESLAHTIENNAMAIVPGATHVYRNMDVDYPFRQFSDFAYLTEWYYPDAWWLLKKEGSDVRVVLCCQDSDPEIERWEGRRLKPDAILDQGHADEVIYRSELTSLLKQWLTEVTTVYFPFEKKVQVESMLNSVLDDSHRRPVRPKAYLDLSPILGAKRLYKSEHEIELMRQACQISTKAHESLMRQVKDKTHEYQLSSLFRDVCFQAGSEHLAYESIVASGENACILHYRTCRDAIDPNGLILVDAGCEWQGYASDITRTFPANGQFSSEQRDIYQIVLEAQQAVIDLVKPGVGFDALHRKAGEIMSQGIHDLGILSNTSYDIKDLFFHGVSHWLGRDVHDPCPYSDQDNHPMTLQPGMVITVEPGLYISNQLKEISPNYHSIGIRIEDDVLVTEQGSDVLSKDCCKTIEAIEDIMKV